MPCFLPSPLLHLTKVALNLWYLEHDDTTRVLCFLSNVSALDELKIWVNNPWDTDGWSDLPDIAQALAYPEPSLPLLRRIRLKGPYICTLTLLYYMHFGPACGIELIPDITEPMDLSMEVLKRFLQRRPFGQDGVVAAFMRSTASTPDFGDVKWQLHSRADPQSTDGDTVLKLKAEPEHTGGIARAIQWDGLRDLTVDGTKETVADTLFAATRSSRALASVTVVGRSSIRCFCNALLPETAPDTTPAVPGVPSRHSLRLGRRGQRLCPACRRAMCSDGCPCERAGASGLDLQAPGRASAVPPTSPPVCRGRRRGSICVPV
jgi:hypothetical protein